MRCKDWYVDGRPDRRERLCCSGSLGTRSRAAVCNRDLWAAITARNVQPLIYLGLRAFLLPQCFLGMSSRQRSLPLILQVCPVDNDRLNDLHWVCGSLSRGFVEHQLPGGAGCGWISGQVLPACRATYHYRSHRPEQAPLRKRIREIAERHMRYGYRRITVLLRREGRPVNVKRVHRLYRLEGLQMPRGTAYLAAWY